MSYLDLDRANPGEVVSQYLLEIAGRGTLLSYTDYEIVGTWVAASRDLDQLLAILTELAPPYFDKTPKPRTLKGLKRPVLSRLSQLR